MSAGSPPIEVIDRLRPKLEKVAGARLFLRPGGQIGGGGRQGNGSQQYTVQADSLEELNTWVPKITDALQEVPELTDVNSDQQDKGLQVDLKVDRATAARLGLTSPRSTMRCMTPSVSAKSRPSTRTRTSTK